MKAFDRNDFYAVILAGGSGTRFWPLSRPKQPKQFLKLFGPKSLFQKTVERALSVVPARNVLVVTGSVYRAIVARQLSSYKIRREQVLCEPSGKNTAPAICWAAMRISAMNPTAMMAVLPSDHLVLNAGKFREYIFKARELAHRGFLVMAGITPTRPETGYGYLKTKKILNAGRAVYRIDRFIEKPSLKKAESFVKAGRYFWNGGMFVWKVERIIEEYRKCLPAVYRAMAVAMSRDKGDVRKVWPRLPIISVDHGILEKTSRLATVVASGMGWSDVGSWEALYQVSRKDKNDNVVQGEVVALDSRNNFLKGQSRLMATVGIDGLIVVDTPEALLICRKDLSQKVKDLVAAIERKRQLQDIL